ncbi:MAG: hypothetical protein GEU90_08415 [Gemmatimonas sp.]|nr:hypothetical protein [Gemmatimonas sp.]
MNRTIGLLAMLPFLLVIGCTTPPGEATPEAPEASVEEIRNVILLIADGAGIGIWSAGAYGQEELAVEGMPVVGLIDTRSASHKVTDSAAGATAFATGKRGVNRTISVGGDCPMPASSDPETAAGRRVVSHWRAGSRSRKTKARPPGS